MKTKLQHKKTGKIYKVLSYLPLTLIEDVKGARKFEQAAFAVRRDYIEIETSDTVVLEKPSKDLVWSYQLGDSQPTLVTSKIIGSKIPTQTKE